MTQNNELNAFLLRLLVFTAVLFGIHAYLIYQFFTGELLIPVWSVYVFNAILVIGVYSGISYLSKKGSKKIFYTFVAMTLLKMVLSVVFLSPIFFKETEHTQLEIINFFVPYFLFLTFEILSINKFLQKL